MSVQEREKEIIDKEQTQKDKNLSSNNINKNNYHFNVTASSNFSQYKILPQNFDEFIYNRQIIKTMKEIKYNYLEEHKNIINTYYFIYSKRLDEIFNYKLNNLSTIEKYSGVCNNINQKTAHYQIDTMTIINDIVNKNMDTFIKSLELVQKFYSDVIESYCNYIRNFKYLNDK